MGFMVLVLAALMLGERNRDARAKVSVIVCDSDNSGWAAFEYGVRMAAEDRGIEVVIAATVTTARTIDAIFFSFMIFLLEFFGN